MQGLTNRALRSVFGRTASPDVLFTEFVRVRPGAAEPIAATDFVEAQAQVDGIPLVVQVIGSAEEGVIEAARELVARGVEHLNVNMGCPFGRMTSVLAGGGMFRHPETIAPMLDQLREIVPGSLSVKTRTGLEDNREIFALLPALEAANLDFLVVHARTVKQKYQGAAAHDITREVVGATSLPVIANGDIRTVDDAERILAHTGATGLMLGRGAISDPTLFERIRGRAPSTPTLEERQRQVSHHLLALLDAYRELFCGDAQILAKVRETLVHIDDEALARLIKSLKKCKRVDAAEEILRDAARLTGVA